MKLALVHSAVIAGVALTASPVFGDDGTSGTATTATDSGSPQASSIESIVVTARRVEERAGDVPISLSALGAESLESTGAYALDDIQHQVPSLVAFDINPRNSSIGIRGLGVSAAQDGLDTSVGVYVDGVYLGRPGMALEDLIDIRQVEVLRGPQGTLFGRNSSAGVVNITTAAPSLTPSVTAEASLGKYGYNQARLAVNAPLISDMAAFRLTAWNTARDGYLQSYTTGGRDNSIHRSGVRSQLLVVPTDALSIRLIGEYSQENDSANTYAITQILPDSISAGTSRTKTALAQTGWTPFASDNATGINSLQEQRTRQAAVSARVDYDLGWSNFTSISAYRYWQYIPRADSDFTPLDIVPYNAAETHDTQVTQELRLASKPGALTWQTGVYLFHQHLNNHYIFVDFGTQASAFFTNLARLADPAAPAVNIEPGSQYIDDVVTTSKSAAWFGQANWELVHGLTLTGGLRYTQDWRDGRANSSTRGTPPANIAAPFNYDLSVNTNNVSGLASLAYKATLNTLFYASYSRGYKGAGLNLDAAGVPVNGRILKPELSDNYEIGAKLDLLHGGLVVNGDLYWTTLEGLQATYIPTNGQKAYLTNAGDVRSRGVELEVDLEPVRGFKLSANGAYNEALYTSYPNAPCPVGVTGVCSLTGRQVYEAPKWVSNVTARYEFRYGVASLLYVQGQYAYTSAIYGTIDDSLLARMPGYSLANFRIGSTFADGKYDLAVWANNAFDKLYYSARLPVSFSGSSAFGIISLPGAPRTVGCTLRAKF
jgi:iron complex outermembrane recepter protein